MCEELGEWGVEESYYIRAALRRMYPSSSFLRHTPPIRTVYTLWSRSYDLDRAETRDCIVNNLPLR